LARLAALRYGMRRSRIDRDLQQQFETHMEHLVERYIASGIFRGFPGVRIPATRYHAV
jgi:hypothetical protein